ncbi:hypothetical protein N7931_15580 [Catenovulum sp. 2E275]|uniref:tetratricopeptide repeat protein n=1 Tax=Catenovulum sp. 2E275 TaxID=2980497 RepID=UPI0021D35A55|nr:hypothetical protein [Catenovulum sp. 2E275]MCU4677054.1 hypothetical protein [Catenovulum sp. 2E275]
MQKPIAQFIQSLILSSGLAISTLVYAGDINQADEYFINQDYAKAQQAYVDLSQVGNAKAFYQLGVMNLQGLGTTENMLKAVLWFDLAAEQNYADAKAVVADLLKLAAPQTQQNIQNLQQEFRKQHGWQAIQTLYFPIVKSSITQDKIYFGQNKNVTIPATFHDTKAYEINGVSVNQQTKPSVKYRGDLNPPLDRNQAEFFFGRLSSSDLFMRDYSAVVDYDIAPDGSVRNLQFEQKIGRLHPHTVANLKEFNSPPPQFEQTKVSFFNRSFIGLAGQTEQYVRNHREDVYAGLVRAAKKLKQDQSAEGQFQYAMALTNFNWLAQDKNELEHVLTKLAKQGHPLAQYELGIKLYREQKDINQAINWLGESAKSGIAKAEYRLGSILLNSPWVEKDESKAVFWLTRATEQLHPAALLSLAELNLLSDNQELHNVESAHDYLAKIPTDLQTNPQFEYLQAMVNFKKVPRELNLAVNHIEKAIALGQDLNWDVSYWQQLLANWTNDGKVKVIDQPLAKL